MTRSAKNRLAWAGGLLLVAVHLWPWRFEGDWASWLPAELGLRLIWLACACGYLLWFCGSVWTGEDEG